jgi:hypothetical protein
MSTVARSPEVDLLDPPRASDGKPCEGCAPDRSQPQRPGHRRRVHAHAAAGRPLRDSAAATVAGLCGHGDADARALNRRQRRHLQRGERDPHRAIAVPGSGSPRAAVRRGTDHAPLPDGAGGLP